MRVDLQHELRERSGRVESSDPLVSLLYQLMRDHLTPGEVHQLVHDATRPGPTLFTNGYLAQDAIWLAEVLRRPVEAGKAQPKEDARGQGDLALKPGG